jgi:hypothetical protein
LDFAKRRVVSIFICVPLKVRSQETPSPTVKKEGHIIPKCFGIFRFISEHY